MIEILSFADMAATKIDPSAYGLLKEIIDETYRDGIDRIDEAWAYPDGSIQAFVTDEGRQLAVEIGEDVSIFQTGEGASFQASFAGGKPRNCQKGTACGGTCIAKGKTCSKKASAGQKEKAKEILAMVHVPKKTQPSPPPSSDKPEVVPRATVKKLSDAEKKEVLSQLGRWKLGSKIHSTAPGVLKKLHISDETTDSRANVKDFYKQMAVMTHPDKGGSAKHMTALSDIKDQLMAKADEKYASKAFERREWLNGLKPGEKLSVDRIHKGLSARFGNKSIEKLADEVEAANASAMSISNEAAKILIWMIDTGVKKKDRKIDPKNLAQMEKLYTKFVDKLPH